MSAEQVVVDDSEPGEFASTRQDGFRAALALTAILHVIRWVAAVWLLFHCLYYEVPWIKKVYEEFDYPMPEYFETIVFWSEFVVINTNVTIGMMGAIVMLQLAAVIAVRGHRRVIVSALDILNLVVFVIALAVLLDCLWAAQQIIGFNALSMATRVPTIAPASPVP